MGLQILPADIPPPARIKGDSAPQLPARDLTSRFDGYLNDARSVVEADPAPQTKEAPRTDAEPPKEVDEIDDDAAHLEDHAEETTDHDPIIVAPAPVALASDTSGIAPSIVEPQAEASPSIQQQPTGITPNPSSESTLQGSSQPAPADSPQQVQTPSQQATVSDQIVEHPVNHDNRRAPTSEGAAKDGRTATKTLPDQPRQVRELVDGPYQQTQQSPDQSRAADQSRARQEAVGPHQQPPLESQYPRLTTTQSEALPSNQPSPPGQPNQRSTDQSRDRKGAVGVRPQSPLPKPVILKAGKGDPAAAAFARFLITPANQPGSGEGNRAPNTTSTAGVGQTATNAAPAAVAGQAPVADLVADLLAARVDEADAIKGAARVLNASGRSGKFEVTMQLDPPELGHLKLQIQMHQQGLSLRVNAASHDVARMIESRLAELSDALATHGIRVDRAEVTVRSAASTQADTQSPQDNGPSTERDFNQPATQDQDGGDQDQAAPHRTANQHLSDPKHPVEDLDGGPYQDDPASRIGLGVGTNDPITPATELSVNLVA